MSHLRPVIAQNLLGNHAQYEVECSLPESGGTADQQRGIAPIDGMAGDMTTLFAELPAGVRTQHLADDLFILTRVNAASRIDHAASWSHSIQSCA